MSNLKISFSGPMNLGPMVPGMPGMAGAGFPTPFGRMTDGRGAADQMGSQMGPQMGPQMGSQMGPQMGPQMGAQMGGMPEMSGMSGMPDMSGMSGFSPMMSNDKMVMAS